MNYCIGFSCDDLLESENVTVCVWDYSGLGMEYQVLAGPAFVFVFTTAGIVIGAISDKFNRCVCSYLMSTASSRLIFHMPFRLTKKFGKFRL